MYFSKGFILPLMIQIQTNIVETLLTSRVKCLISHPDYPYILSGLYTGEIQQIKIENGKFIINKTIKISEGAVRTLVFNLKSLQIFVGTDDGIVAIIDSESLNLIKSFTAHDDFIRTIVVNNYQNCFLTASDDHCVKLFDLETLTLKNLYNDFKHYIMDIKFDPIDSTLFYTVSLDGKIRKYSIFNTKRIDTLYCKPDTKNIKILSKKGFKSAINSLKIHKGISLKTFNNLSGINTLEFINDTCFITGNDDGYITIYDKNKNSVINMLKVHDNQINKIKRISGTQFATVSNDGTLKIFNDMLHLETIIRSNYKVWDFCVYNKEWLIVGTDEEYLLYHIINERAIKKMSKNKLFILKNTGLYQLKIEDNIEKFIGTFNNDIINFVLSLDGKFIATISYSEICIYSLLGLRKKFEIKEAQDIAFINDKFYIIKNNSIIKYNMKFNEESQIKLDNLEKIIDVHENILLINTNSSTVLITDTLQKIQYPLIEDGVILFDLKTQKLVVLLLDDNRCFQYEEDKLKDEINIGITNYIVKDNIIYFNTELEIQYGFIFNSKFYYYELTLNTSQLLGYWNNSLYAIDNKSNINNIEIDHDFIQFQIDTLNEKYHSNIDKFKNKALLFYESIGKLDLALSSTLNENQEFEIYLKLNKLDDAFKIANSPAKFDKLGEKYIELFNITNNKQNLEYAGNCFYKSGDLTSLFYSDIMTNKKYLSYIGETAKIQGKINLSLIAFFIDKNFKQCYNLIKNTKYEKMVRENFLKNND